MNNSLCRMRIQEVNDEAISDGSDKEYTIEEIDTWNMTRKVVATGQSGFCKVRISEKQWMAVVATLEESFL